MITLLADNRLYKKKQIETPRREAGFGAGWCGKRFFWGGSGLRQNAGFASLSTGFATVSFLFAGVVGAGEAVVGGRCGWVFPLPFSKEKRNVGLFAGSLRFFSL